MYEHTITDIGRDVSKSKVKASENSADATPSSTTQSGETDNSKTLSADTPASKDDAALTEHKEVTDPPQNPTAQCDSENTDHQEQAHQTS